MNNETKLTEEQIEKAARCLNTGWQCGYRPESIVQSVAQFVQYPIAPPTEEEVKRAVSMFWGERGTCVDSTRTMLLDFIALRSNTQMTVKVDPRKEKIVEIFQSMTKVPSHFEDVADKILAALDEIQAAKK